MPRSPVLLELTGGTAQAIGGSAHLYAVRYETATNNSAPTSWELAIPVPLGPLDTACALFEAYEEGALTDEHGNGLLFAHA